MILRMASRATTSYLRPSYMRMTVSAEAEVAMVGAAAGGAVGVATGADAAAGLAPSTSALTMRPCGPEPVIFVRFKPFSAAMRRARGEAKTRAPAGLAAVGAGGSAAAGAAATGVAVAGAAVAAGAATVSALSPSSRITAIGVLTFTPAVPSAISSLPTIPSSTASNSIVALSVSISARICPDLTVSPSFTSHLARVPSSIVGERAGIRICVAIFCPP